MTLILHHKKMLIIVISNVLIALLLAFISVWLVQKNVLQDALTVGEIFKSHLLVFLKISLISFIFQYFISYLMIKTTTPVLKDLLENEKDLNIARKKSEKNEKALTTLIRQLPAGLVLYDIKEDETYFNDYAITYLGFTSEHKVKGLVGTPLRLVKEDGSDIPVDQYPLSKVIATHTILKNEIGGIVDQQGNIVWVVYNAFPVYNSIGYLKQIVVTFLDVTEQRNLNIELEEANIKLKDHTEELTQLLDNVNELNEKIAESEARYKLISDFSTSWETYRHPDGKLVYCSPAVDQFIGYTQEEFLKGISFSTFVHPDDLKEFTEQFNNGLAGKFVPSCIVRLIHKDQTEKWVDYAFRPVLSEKGVHLGTRFSVRDVTKLKVTELALHESRELLNLIFQYSTTWEGYRDKNGKLVYCSLAIEQMIGYTVEEFMSNKIGFKDFIHPDDYEMAMYQFSRVLSGETLSSHILRYIHKNKNIVWADVSARPVFSDAYEILGFRFSSKDITKLKENELKLKELNATKDKFFSIISHDLKSPFNALIGFSDMLLEEHKLQSDEQREEIISFINEVARNTFKLLENLLAWARSQSGRLKLNLEKVNLKVISAEIADLLMGSANNKKISLTNSITNDIWVWVDCNLLNTIIRNLISNSIKYTKESGIVTLGAEIKDGFAEVYVSDTGVGFDDSILTTLFTVGDNRSTPGTNNEIGTGLGLILCKDFVEKMGGQIWASSEIGKGSTFKFTVPLYL